MKIKPEIFLLNKKDINYEKILVLPSYNRIADEFTWCYHPVKFYR